MKPSFFKNLGPITVKDIKREIKCNVHLLHDDDNFTDFQNIKELNSKSLSFLNDNEYSSNITYNEGAIICSNSTHKKLKGSNPTIEVDSVHLAVAKLSNIFYRLFTVNEVAKFNSPNIGANSQIADSSVLENGCIIGSNVRIGSGCKIGYNCIIGNNTQIESNTVITNSIIAENVYIGRNTSIGQAGFGFAINKNHNIKILHIGRVILQAGVNIGSNCTIDRGSFGDTIIGENTYFDNSCHVAHNVIIGNNCIFAAMCGIAGSTVIDDNVMAGGQSGIAGHLTIGKNVKIAAQSGVLKNLKDNSIVMGHPAINKIKYIRNFKKYYE